MIYIPFSALASALTHLIVCSLRGGFYSNSPAVISMVGIWPIRFFIRRFYNNFPNRFCYFHAFKQFTATLKVMDSQSNHCTYACLLQLLRVLFKNISSNYTPQILLLAFAPGNKSKYSLRSFRLSAYSLNFYPCRFLMTRRFAQMFWTAY